MRTIIVIVISLFCTLAAQSQLIYEQTTGQYVNVNVDYTNNDSGTTDIRIRDYNTGNTIKGTLEKDSGGDEYSGRLRDNYGHGYHADINDSGRIRLRQMY